MSALWLLLAALAACTLSSQENAMHSRSLSLAAPRPDLNKAVPDGRGADAAPPANRTASAPTSPETSASAAEARGRRTLSTAYVRMGPDGQLTVELLNGSVLVLRNIVMRPNDFCGVQVADTAAGAKFCGRYGNVATATPGGALVPDNPGQVR